MIDGCRGLASLTELLPVGIFEQAKIKCEEGV